MTGRPPLDHKMRTENQKSCLFLPDDKKDCRSTVQQKITYTLLSVLTSLYMGADI